MAETTEVIPLQWPHQREGNVAKRSSIRAPKDLKKRIDDLLSVIEKKSGAKFSRNEFIVRSVQFYFEHLVSQPSVKSIIADIDTEYEKNP